MAITVTDRGTTSGYGQNPSVGNTFTPAEDSIIVVFATDWADYFTAAAAANWNITFSQIGTTIQNVSDPDYVSVWAGRVGASPTSDQIDMSSSASAGYDVSVIELIGVNADVSVASVFVQTISSSAYNPTDPYVINGTGFASAFGSATNATLVFGLSGETDKTFTAQTGFSSVNTANTYRKIEVFFNPNEEQDPELDYSSAGAAYLGLAYEIDEATASSGIVVLRRRREE